MCEASITTLIGLGQIKGQEVITAQVIMCLPLCYLKSWSIENMHSLRWSWSGALCCTVSLCGLW